MAGEFQQIITKIESNKSLWIQPSINKIKSCVNGRIPSKIKSNKCWWIWAKQDKVKSQVKAGEFQQCQENWVKWKRANLSQVSTNSRSGILRMFLGRYHSGFLWIKFWVSYFAKLGGEILEEWQQTLKKQKIFRKLTKFFIKIFFQQF